MFVWLDALLLLDTQRPSQKPKCHGEHQCCVEQKYSLQSASSRLQGSIILCLNTYCYITSLSVPRFILHINYISILSHTRIPSNGNFRGREEIAPGNVRIYHFLAFPDRICYHYYQQLTAYFQQSAAPHCRRSRQTHHNEKRNHGRKEENEEREGEALQA